MPGLLIMPLMETGVLPARADLAASIVHGSSGARLQGHWTAPALARRGLVAALTDQLRAAIPAGGIAQDPQAWDLLALDALDHTGAQLLWNSWGRQWPQRLDCLPAQRAMLERVARFSPPRNPTPLRSWMTNQGTRAAQGLEALGAGIFALGGHLADLTRLVGQLLLDFIQLARAPHKGPWRDVSGNLYRIGALAMPITALVGFLIGVVLAYLMSQQLRLFGADAFIVDVLGISLIRELGPVLAAILLAGRSGSSITAQIGVMRVTEELDAMKVMGIPLGYRLVMPRAIAMAVAMPLIAVWTMLAALAGGMLAADLVLGISPRYFYVALPHAVQDANLWLAVAKSVVFGLLIALTGCHYGLRVKPNTESLGQGTTASVVTSITLVILVDAVFAVLFKDVGI
jgi:phospholipid/cholesterol/gamma-HCH transport system permease protein